MLSLDEDASSTADAADADAVADDAADDAVDAAAVSNEASFTMLGT